MNRKRSVLMLFVAAMVWTLMPGVRAANSPTFRDCALPANFDPDFVQLSGVTVGADGSLSVIPSQNSVQMVASESSDPGDSAGHDTLNVTVSAADVPTQSVSGAAVGHVTLAVPLIGSGQGRKYTLSWSATFDNGQHMCPSPVTPANTAPEPFVISVHH